MIQVYFLPDRPKLEHPLFCITEQELQGINNWSQGLLPYIDPYGLSLIHIYHRTPEMHLREGSLVADRGRHNIGYLKDITPYGATETDT